METAPVRSATRLRRIENFVRRRLGSIEHERRVRSLATALFDLTAHRHGLQAPHRRLLEIASILHDVGRSIADEGHERLGAKLVLRAPLPLKRSERRALSFLTRYHRGSVASLGQEKYLRPGDDRAALRKLLGLLRAADALDGRSLDAPRIQMLLWRDRLHIECRLQQECQKARRAFARPKKFRLIEDALGLQVHIHISCGSLKPVSLAA